MKTEDPDESLFDRTATKCGKAMVNQWLMRSYRFFFQPCMVSTSALCYQEVTRAPQSMLLAMGPKCIQCVVRQNSMHHVSNCNRHGAESGEVHQGHSSADKSLHVYSG